MQTQNLIKIIEAQRRALISLEKQIFHIASAAQLHDNEELNNEIDIFVAELKTINNILYPGTE